MVMLVEAPRIIEYRDRMVKVAIKAHDGRAVHLPGSKWVEASVLDADSDVTARCGATLLPLRMAIRLACRRAIQAVDRATGKSPVSRLLGWLRG